MRSARLSCLALALVAGTAWAADAPIPFRYARQTLSAAERPKIAALYANTCSGCHGKSGEGAGNGLSLFGTKDPLANAAVMHFGRIQPPPGNIQMPAYGAEGMLTPAEIGKLSAYIEGFRPPWP